MTRLIAAGFVAVLFATAANADPVSLGDAQLDRIVAGDAASLTATPDDMNVGGVTPVYLVDAGDGSQVRVVDDPAGHMTALDATSFTRAN